MATNESQKPKPRTDPPMPEGKNYIQITDFPRIKIVSDGTVAGTKVYNAVGEEMLGVTSVRWELDVDMPHPECYITRMVNAEILLRGFDLNASEEGEGSNGQSAGSEASE